MIKKPYLTLIGFFFFFYSYSQTVLSGEVKTDNGELLIGATVVISQDTSSSILAYGITDDNGEFHITISSSLNSFNLNISYLGFKKWSLNVENKSANYSVILQNALEELEDVLLDYNPIEKKGDTISYTVASFSDQDDRVIADVIKKLPGIEIKPNGQILYQGRPIQKYYIEGLDLLEGRYNLINNNLSYKAVSKVQILENHQPIKVLDSIVVSERASLNIKLKKDITISGTAKIGSGLPALLWDVNITPIVLSKKKQALTSYQTNNIGKDLSNELINFSDIGEIGGQQIKKEWLSLIDPLPPPFKKERWLDNNAHLGTTNFLWRLKKDLDFKINVSYINDVQTRLGRTNTKFITPNNTIDLIENTDNQSFKNRLQTKLILEQNTNKNYFRNKLEINGFWDSKRGKTQSNNSTISQQLKTPFSIIKNDLLLYKTIGNQLLVVKSKISYSKTNQELRINPGQFSDLVNNGIDYSQSEQFISNIQFFTKNSIGLTKTVKKITISPELGFSMLNETLSSYFITDNENRLLGDFENNIDFKKLQFYAKSDFDFKNDTWNIKLKLPINFQLFDTQDNSFQNSNHKDFLTFEPTLYIRKKLSPFWEMNVHFKRKNNFGLIDRLYGGYILSNYRSINRYDAPLSESLVQNYSYGVSYRNPLKAIFTSLNYTYSTSKNNLLYTANLESNGSTLFQVIEMDNKINSHNLNLNTSKRFKKLKSILSISTSYSVFKSKQLLNDDLSDSRNQNLSFNLTIDSNINNWFSTTLKSNVSFLNTEFQNIRFNEIIRQQHELNAVFFLSKNQFLNINSELYINNISEENGEAFFMNLGYNYTLKKNNIDLYVTWQNIFDEREYVTVFNTGYTSVETRFNMRPSQLFVGLRFSF